MACATPTATPTSARSLSGEAFRSPSGWPELPVVGDLPDLPIVEPQYLEQFTIGNLADGSPAQLYDARGSRVPHEARLGHRVGGDHATAVLEDRPGLGGAVLGGRPAPHPVPALESTPLEIGGKQSDERLQVASNRSVIRALDGVSGGGLHTA